MTHHLFTNASFSSCPLCVFNRCKSIMNVARAKLDLIKPEEVNMDEYEVSRDVLCFGFWFFWFFCFNLK